MTTGEILRKAKDILRERGWCQGELVKFDPVTGQRPVCVEGAMNLALTGSPDDDGGSIRAFLAFTRAVGETAHLWNDAEGRTVEEVQEALDRAIALAEAGQSEGEGGR